MRNLLAGAVALGAAVLVSGCASSRSAEVDRVIREGRASAAKSMQRVQDTTLPSGWRVDCLTDDVHATRQCFASKFTTAGELSKRTDTPLHVTFLDGRGPTISIAGNTYPGRTPTIRVDDNAPVHDLDPEVLVEQFKRGRMARIEYHSWPDGPERATLDLAGFAEAYDLLIAKAQDRQQSSVEE